MQGGARADTAGELHQLPHAQHLHPPGLGGHRGARGQVGNSADVSC